MISRTDIRAVSGREGGFTLIEMLVVMVVLSLLAGLMLARGPSHSMHLELRGVADRVARTMRAGRTMAIVTDRPVLFRLDPPEHGFGLVGGPVQAFPAAVDARLAGVRFGDDPRAETVIRFAPDGSSSGGQVDLATHADHLQITVEWLTGRVDLVSTGIKDDR